MRFDRQHGFHFSLPALLCALPLVLSTAFVHARDCIGVVPAGGGARFWSEVQAGARQAGQELGFDIYFRGPKDEEQPQLQVRIIDAIVLRGCKALVLAPMAASLASTVEKLKRRGIPTVYIDRNPGSAAVAGVVSTDNFAAGIAAGQRMAQLLNGKGQVLLFRLRPGVVSTEQREAGFIRGASQSGLTVRDGGYLGSDIGMARLRASDALKAAAGKMNGIFTPNESTSSALLMSLREAGLAGKIPLIGFDANGLLLSAVRNGEIHTLVLQHPFTIGYRGVALAVRALAEHALPGQTIDTGVTFVDKTHPQPEAR
ncbi:substrate-binding domain-containing protein [Paludibacterium yongneupense]|uniref:ABC transporter substrate-binding protein n=1 Tax=Paludibacterium yongneupense TaxID=400061 RepID=UPI00040FE975|nr:substrate-binding domain-containing protein [Paludibacterium yongneupense]